MAAEEAANRSGVRIRPLTSIGDMRECVELINAIWRPTDESSIMNVEVLQALAGTETYICGAFAGELMLGVCVGMWGKPSALSLHSHIAGVTDSARGRDVGFALKLHQRAWALERGITTITWTFDPLVSRNAHFNLSKLGGIARVYHVNHYGTILDDLNGNDESDRLKLEWVLESPRAISRAALEKGNRTLAPSESVVSRGPLGQPSVHASSAAHVTVAVPTDIEALRHSDPSLASEWRLVVRQVLGTLLLDGGQVEDFDQRAGAYIVSKGPTG
ncbi:hypothetical protein [Arthrobacter sp. GMC3]|uniref:hypothetical protein n=1 Tax=Arthrobacter sp. GMC3 TaxID=2058894 RepID=UPI0011B0C841|nr:hypothetical protein [Arthrobacter sp. GMC3]